MLGNRGQTPKPNSDSDGDLLWALRRGNSISEHGSLTSCSFLFDRSLYLNELVNHESYTEVEAISVVAQFARKDERMDSFVCSENRHLACYPSAIGQEVHDEPFFFLTSK